MYPKLNILQDTRKLWDSMVHPLWDWESPLLPTCGLQNKIQKEDYSLWSLPMYYDFNLWILVCISYWVLLKASRYIYFLCLSECQYINYHNIFTVPKYWHRKVEEEKRLGKISIVNCCSDILVCISEICIGLMDPKGTQSCPGAWKSVALGSKNFCVTM